jgi:plasmid stabilization system protein ParE
MKKPLAYHEDAREDYSEAFIYYKARSERAAWRFEDAVLDCERRISEDPEHFPLRGAVRKCVLTDFPYVIYYRELDASIEVIAVAHAKRNPGYWLSRIESN